MVSGILHEGTLIAATGAEIGLPKTSPSRSRAIDDSRVQSPRSDLNGVVSLGYSKTRNPPSADAVAPIGNLDMVTANPGLNYLFAATLTVSILYTFFTGRTAVPRCAATPAAASTRRSFR